MSANTEHPVIDKVRKLLRLANSPNAHEAALAAAKAQELIDAHKLSAALLEIDGGAPEPDEPIVDFGAKGAPLDGERGRNLDRWRGTLATIVCRANGCEAYQSGSVLHIVGRPSDADTARYLYAYLSAEVRQLCERDGFGCGVTWRNNYRLGVVDTIARKLRDQRRVFVEHARAAAGTESTALVRINSAIAKIERRTVAAQEWGKVTLGLRSRSVSPVGVDRSARQAGQAAGESIALNRSRGGLVSGAKRLDTGRS